MVSVLPFDYGTFKKSCCLEQVKYTEIKILHIIIRENLQFENNSNTYSWQC